MSEYGLHTLEIDAAAEVERISNSIRDAVRSMRRKGVVIALSGGIDSSVVAALAVKAVGPQRVFGLHMPERESSDETLAMSQLVSTTFGFDSVIEDLTAILGTVGAYSTLR